jgi:hypothetical protein
MSCGPLPIVDDPEILVIGSTSVLASYDEDDLPVEATASMEVDLAYLDDPDESKADMVDGSDRPTRAGAQELLQPGTKPPPDKPCGLLADELRQIRLAVTQCQRPLWHIVEDAHVMDYRY